MPRSYSASSPHSGDWLMAPPITLIGLRLSDEMIRIAIGFRLRLGRVSLMSIWKRGKHQRSTQTIMQTRSAQQQRHTELNGII